MDLPDILSGLTIAVYRRPGKRTGGTDLRRCGKAGFNDTGNITQHIAV